MTVPGGGPPGAEEAADVPPAGPGEPWQAAAAVFQVLAVNGDVAGAGFLVGDGIAITCAHVVRAAGQGPGGQVTVAFRNLPGAPRVPGLVSAEGWRAPEGKDIAVLQPATGPADARQPALGAGAGCRGHRPPPHGAPRP
jgi:hypothetical protein